ncbi:MAG: formate/nitrite transporter family protein [Hyphomicrobiaceae bacterium]
MADQNDARAAHAEETTDVDEARSVAREAGAKEREKEIEEHSRLRAVAVFEIIRREGIGELGRDFNALFWSGVAAGLSIGFSLLGEAFLAAHLPKAGWAPLITNLGYSVGFLIVILGRLQLFTENTLTAVLPVMARRRLVWVIILGRLWGIVFAANLVGCMIFAAFMSATGVLSPEMAREVLDISRTILAHPPAEMFARGIVAGWLIAALVWMLPSAEGNEFIVIVLVTYLIALGDFAHVIAGSAEAFYLLFERQAAIGDLVTRFLLPTLAGNVFGGTVVFALTAYAQVRYEIEESPPKS